MFHWKTTLLLLLGFSQTGCIDFSITHEKAWSQFEPHQKKIHFDTLEFDNHLTHFGHISEERDTLIVFLHGSPGSWNAFIDYFKTDSLVDRWDLVSIDRPGFGFSDHGSSEPSLEKQARIMHEVLRQFSNSHKVLVGHSLGGPLSVRMAMDFPEHYQQLILVAPSLDPKFEVDGKLRKWLQTPLFRLLTPTDMRVSNEEIITVKHELMKMENLYPRIKAKVTILHGTKDSLVPVENVAYLQRQMGSEKVEVRLLEGVDHFIPWTHPEEVVKAIEKN